MALYKAYPAHIILLRRAFAVVAGVVALPVMLFWKDRARYYSWLHRVWSKTSEQPVWMAQAEKPLTIFINRPAAKNIRKPPGCPRRFFSFACLHSFSCAATELAGAYFAGARYFCRLIS